MTASSCAGRDGGGPRLMVPWTPAVRVPPSGEGVAGRWRGCQDHDVVNAPIMF